MIQTARRNTAAAIERAMMTPVLAIVAKSKDITPETPVTEITDVTQD